MRIPILIEPIEQGRFRARAGEPFALTAEGDSRQGALQSLERLIQDRLQAGAEVVALPIAPGPTSPPPPFPVPADERYKYDPSYKEFMDEIAENRRREDRSA